VSAGGRVYVAGTEANTVYCLDAATGEVAWSYQTGGRVDSPPSIDRGMAVFGCSDGWVYALRASDGEEAWRFRAAPTDLRQDKRTSAGRGSAIASEGQKKGGDSDRSGEVRHGH
jgi:outer membrane protein assembly factor BamB